MDAFSFSISRHYAVTNGRNDRPPPSLFFSLYYTSHNNGVGPVPVGIKERGSFSPPFLIPIERSERIFLPSRSWNVADGNSSLVISSFPPLLPLDLNVREKRPFLFPILFVVFLFFFFFFFPLHSYSVGNFRQDAYLPPLS